MNIAILITTYNNEENITCREFNSTVMYEDIITWWINETPYTIFLTNSGGTKFNDYIEKNAYTYHFSQDNVQNPDKLSYADHNLKSFYECLSVNKCFKYYEEKLLKFDMIFKLTGKYKFDLEKILPTNISNYDFVRLNNKVRDKINNTETSSYWVPTELIGFKPKFLLDKFYKSNKTGKIIEIDTFDYIYKQGIKYKIYILPTIKNLANWKKNENVGVLHELYENTNTNTNYKYLKNIYNYNEKFSTEFQRILLFKSYFQYDLN